MGKKEKKEIYECKEDKYMSVHKVLVVTVFVFMVTLFGCTTAPKRPSEAELKEFDEISLNTEEEAVAYPERSMLSGLKEQIKTYLPIKKSQSEEKIAKAKEKPKPKHIVSARDIQTSLKNSGYYTGAIDGKIGPMTDKAIRAFQKDNNLKVDGIIGQRTWGLLSKYLSSTGPLFEPPVSPVLGEKVTQSSANSTQQPIVSEPTNSPEPLSTVAVDVTPLEEEPLVLEEAVPARRNFTPFIVVISIIVAVILIISISRRRHS